MEPNATYEIPSTIGVEEMRSKGSATVRPVRTYREDVAKMVTEAGVTKTDIALAETRRREEREEASAKEKTKKSGHEHSHLGTLIFVLILVFAFGLGIGAYVLFSTKAPAPASLNPAPIVPTKDQLTIDIDDSPQAQIFADVSIAFGKTSLPEGGSREVVFLEKAADGSTRPATAQELLRTLSVIPLPSDLLVSLDEHFTYKILSDQGLSGELDFVSRTHDATFAAMYDLEPKLAELFVPLIDPSYSHDDLSSIKGRSFHDEDIGGKDVRILSDAAGNVILGYGFVDQKTFVIAGTRTAFAPNPKATKK